MSEDSQSAVPYIMLKAEDGTQEKVLLSGPAAWNLGRDKDNSIVIIDKSVSRHHAILYCLDSGSIYLSDLGSTNGSFVNQKRVTIPTLLQDGDQITLGESEMKFHHSLPTATETSAEAFTGIGAKTSILHKRKQISVMVVDIRGFTQLSQQIDVRVLSELMGLWFRQAGEIVHSRGSQVDKYIGDAVMAVWVQPDPETGDEIGLPSPESNSDVLLALRTLVALFEMTEALNHNPKLPPLPNPLRIGGGLNTGLAIVGQMGSGNQQEYTVIGDTVNAAFRLESTTRVIDADIAISKDTHTAFCAQALAGKPEGSLFRLAKLKLKGYETDHEVYHCHYEELRDFLAAWPS